MVIDSINNVLVDDKLYQFKYDLRKAELLVWFNETV